MASNKSAVANKMADNGAILMLLNGVDDGTNSAAELDGQPLYYGEMQVEGSDWYMQQNYEHRDASYEEILHLVHDYGIGVDSKYPVYWCFTRISGEILERHKRTRFQRNFGLGRLILLAGSLN